MSSDEEPVTIRIKAMTIDDYLKRLLVEGKRGPDWFARRPRDFSDPTCPCTRNEVKLEADGTCPLCGYDW